MMMISSGGHMGWLVADLKKTLDFTESSTRTASCFYFLRKGNVMDDEITMIEQELQNIVVPSFSPPCNLSEDIAPMELLTITSEINADDRLMKNLVFIGIVGHPLGQNKMMNIISVDDISCGRVSYNEVIVRVRMEMGDIKTVLSIELSKEQLQEILKIGLRTQFGPSVDSVKMGSMYHSLKKYEIEVTFKGRG